MDLRRRRGLRTSRCHEICWSFAQPSESRLWILAWIWSWDPLKLCDVIRRTTLAPPGKTPAGQDPEAHSPPQSPQQRSDQTRKPVNSEQDNCPFDSNHGLRIAIRWGGRLLLGSAPAGTALALSGDPVDQTCGIQQRCCLIEELLDVHSDLKPKRTIIIVPPRSVDQPPAA